MQQSGVLLSSLTSLLGLELPAGSRARSDDATGVGEDGFAALLAAINVPVDGAVAPPGGKVLPSGGNVLPLGAASGSLLAGDAGRGPAVFPFATTPADVARDNAAHGREAPRPAPDGVSTAALQVDGSSPAEPSEIEARFVRAADSAPVFRSADTGWPPAPSDADPASVAETLDVAPPLPEDASAPEQKPAARAADRVDAPRSDAPDSTANPLDRIAKRGVDAAIEGGTADDAARDALAARLTGKTAAASGAEPGGGASAASPAPTPAAAPPAPIDIAADVQPPESPHQPDEAGSPARAAPAELGESVASRIRVMVNEGAGEARLRLDPPDLGTIDVRISVVDDKTFVHLTASHSTGREALEQSLPRLREMLGAAGLDVGGASVSGGGSGPASGFGAGERERGYVPQPELIAADALHSGEQAHRRPSGRIDLYA